MEKFIYFDDVDEVSESVSLSEIRSYQETLESFKLRSDNIDPFLERAYLGIGESYKEPNPFLKSAPAFTYRHYWEEHASTTDTTASQNDTDAKEMVFDANDL